MDSKEAEQKVLDLCQKYDGVTEKQILQSFPSLRSSQLKDIYNNLLAKNKVDLLKKGKELLLKYKDPQNSVRLTGTGISPEEQKVFDIIQESGSRGIWIKDIRAKCSLPFNIVSKVVKKLESKKLIKSFNALSAPTKKIYLLFELQPHKSLTGGAFYTDQQFDSELVDILNHECYKFLENKAATAREIPGGPRTIKKASHASTEEVLKYITDLGILTVQLTLEEMESILETLVFDGKAEKVSGDFYKLASSFVSTPALMKIPCGVCPVIDSCADVGDITSSKCIYMKDWIGW